MGRKPVSLTPRKVLTNGHAERWEVRVPAEFRKQEAATRRFFAKQIEAQGYCNRLKIDLRNYSDKARGLTDAPSRLKMLIFPRPLGRGPIEASAAWTAASCPAMDFHALRGTAWQG